MLVGNARAGKSVLVGDKLGSLDREKYMILNLNLRTKYCTSIFEINAHRCMLAGTVYAITF